MYPTVSQLVLLTSVRQSSIELLVILNSICVYLNIDLQVAKNRFPVKPFGFSYQVYPMTTETEYYGLYSPIKYRCIRAQNIKLKKSKKSALTEFAVSLLRYLPSDYCVRNYSR